MQPDYAMIPLLKRTIKAGLNLLMAPVRLYNRRRRPQKSAAPSMEVPNHILLAAVREAIAEGHTATISVKGWSMRPFLEHLRDKVLLDAPDGAKVGDAVLAEISPGLFVLHRIIGLQPHPSDHSLDAITLMGDGNIRGTEHCMRRDICGIVTRYIYPDKTVPAGHPALQRRIRRWRRLLPVRRYLLAIYRATL